MMHDNWGYGSGYDTWNLINFIYVVFSLALFIIGAFVVAHYLRRDTSITQKSETAIDVLKKRYAKGEINKQEFEEKRKDLSAK